MYSEFIYGLKRGYPVALGYLPVAFTFGLMAVSGGLPVWMAVFISMSNLTTFLGAGAGAYFFPADEREDEKAKHSSGWTDGEIRIEERAAEIQNAEITDLKKEEGRSCI